MSSNLLNDDRVRWIRQRVVMSLEIPVESFDRYFTDSLDRARSASLARENFKAFLSKSHGCGSTIFFSCNKWVEDVEGTNHYVLCMF
jgi:hypothetical protein